MTTEQVPPSPEVQRAQATAARRQARADLGRALVVAKRAGVSEHSVLALIEALYGADK